MKRLKIILVYFFLDRSLSSIYYLQHSPMINKLYTGLGKLIGLSILLFTLQYLLSHRRNYKYATYILSLAISMFVPTLLYGGSISRWLQIFYPIMCMLPFLCLQFRKEHKISLFFDSVSILYLAIAGVNLVLLVVSPYMFSESILGQQTYLLGGENLVQHPLMIGLLINMMNNYVNKNKIRTLIYVLVHLLTTFIIFSATSIVACLICISAIYVKYISKLMAKISMKFLIGIALLGFVMVVCLGGMGFFESSYVAPIIEILGKDSTLSGRTDVWIVAMLRFFEHPILGNGVADTVNIFDVWGTNANGVSGYSTLSAHNQFLQTMVEGGVVAVGLLFIFLFKVGKYLDTLPSKYSVLSKSVILAFLVLNMGEAAGLYNIFFVCVMSMLIGTMYLKIPIKD